MSVTKEQIKGAVNIVFAVAESIRAAGSIPSGIVYGAISGTVDLAGYERIIQILKDAGVVRQSGLLLVWTGPGAEVAPLGVPAVSGNLVNEVSR